MQRNKQTYKDERDRAVSINLGAYGRSSLEGQLLDFLDSFDIHLFLYDPAYRRSLNEMLERFTDEEFEDFTRTHSHRFTVN